MSNMLMAFFSWWYGAGWRRQGLRVSEQLAQLLDTFSFTLLLRTVFSPFRQISAGTVDGPLGIQLRAWFDQLISRFIGAMIRTTTMITGVIVLFVSLLLGVIRIGIWPLLPVLPLLVMGFWMAGWLSWN